ncbi:hypothetical protein BIW11_06674, partial [Tropilaelaps mercedesae]
RQSLTGKNKVFCAIIYGCISITFPKTVVLTEEIFVVIVITYSDDSSVSTSKGYHNTHGPSSTVHGFNE